MPVLSTQLYQIRKVAEFTTKRGYYLKVLVDTQRFWMRHPGPSIWSTGFVVGPIRGHARLEVSIPALYGVKGATLEEVLSELRELGPVLRYTGPWP